MRDEVRLNKFFLIDRGPLFTYFVTPELLEQWAVPNAMMSLRVPYFEAKEGGKYRFEHSSPEGKYICTGTMIEMIPGEKLIQCDDLITGPKGETLQRQLETTIEFFPKLGGTEIRLVVRGLEKERDREECERAWSSCLEKLAHLVNIEAGKSGEQESEQSTQL